MKTDTKRNPWLKTRNKHLILGIAIITLLAGIWLTVYPQIERQRTLYDQARLMESITDGDGTMILDPVVAWAEPDFYAGPDEEDTLYPGQWVSSGLDDSHPPVESVELADAESDIITGIGILSIDKIDLRLPVVDGVSKRQLKVAVGRVPQTAEIGAIGNAVIAGHRSYAYGQYFNRLGELENGDIIEYQPREGETMRFEVYNIRIIRPGDQSAFQQPGDFSEITLYTCTPIRVASHRLLIQAKLITD